MRGFGFKAAACALFHLLLVGPAPLMANPAPLTWQVERILIQCTVTPDEAAGAFGEALCEEVTTQAQRHFAQPVLPLEKAPLFDPLSDLVVTVDAALEAGGGGTRLLTIRAAADRRGFPAQAAGTASASIGGSARPERAQLASLVAAALKPILSGHGAGGDPAIVN